MPTRIKVIRPQWSDYFCFSRTCSKLKYKHNVHLAERERERERESKSGFTLIELLIVIAILAVLTAAVVVVLSPVSLFEQARDGTRIADLESIATAVGIAKFEGVYLGTSSIAYLSLPDSSSTCGSYSLPTLPSGWSYHCATSANLTKNDGTGWMPVNFTALDALAFGKLPVDPVNEATSSLYYVYTAGDSEDPSAPELVAPSEGGTGSRTAPPAGGRCSGVFNISRIPRSTCGVPATIVASLGQTISGTKAWYKADALTLSDLDSVSTWTDSSGSGYNLTQSGTARPIFHTNQLNGWPTVRFDGTDDLLSKTMTESLFAPTDDLTIFAVFKVTDSASRALIGQDGGAGINPKWFVRHGTPSGPTDAMNWHVHDGVATGGFAHSDSVFASGAFHLATVAKSGSTYTWFKNGVNDGSDTVAIDFPTQTNALTMGFAEGTDYFIGDIAEIIVYTRPLSSASREQVFAYLQNKYGI